ncbi:hypothetical protein [Trujillonella endophytica]|uniref:Uncharacterized protein n=1 Tax=Trujillonella endophytica TaxID=673521 RepID=A0A1H8RGY3_9ACTN|nr:hypothetical protein [Trujillella endophytica]SEO65582.1 hypothetical protein SAMN05660991_01099 [Trujillella endophytica]
MSDPRRDPETGGRSLADILREAGVDSPRTGRRRRGETGEQPAVRQRGTRGGDGGDADTGRVAEAAPFGRRAADTGKTPPIPPADPVKARVRTPADPLGGSARPTADLAVPRGRAPEGPSTAAISGLRTSRKPGVPGASGPDGADPSTGPIPVVRDDDPPLLDDEPAGGALAWLRFAGELVVALAGGVGIYLLFTVLWEQLPRVTVLIAPLAVTALVGAVGAWRHRFGGEALGLRLVVVLVFAGTLLTVAPAAALLGSS